MDEPDDRDLAAEIDELRARQEWAEERIRTLAEAMQLLLEQTAPNPMARTTRQVVSSRLDRALGRGKRDPAQE
jgi:hypothetical protein